MNPHVDFWLPDGTGPQDFEVRIGRSDHGTFVKVIHHPTGISVWRSPLGEETPNEVTHALLRTLLAKVAAHHGSP